MSESWIGALHKKRKFLNLSGLVVSFFPSVVLTLSGQIQNRFGTITLTCLFSKPILNPYWILSCFDDGLPALIDTTGYIFFPT